MATRTKMAFTDYQAYKVLTTYLSKVEIPDDVIAEALGDAYNADKHTPENIARKVSHKYHVLAEQAAKPKAPSKAAALNKSLAEQVYNAHVGGEAFTLADIMAEHPEDVKTYGKASAVLGVLMLDKRAVKAAPINGKTAYIVKA